MDTCHKVTGRLTGILGVAAVTVGPGVCLASHNTYSRLHTRAVFLSVLHMLSLYVPPLSLDVLSLALSLCLQG